MAENSTVSFRTFIMDGEDFIMFLLLTTVAVTYVLLERKYFLKIWNKCKSTILESYNCKQMSRDPSIRLSLLAVPNWQYRGEGNEYLAISLPDKKQILRLRKATFRTGFFACIQHWYKQNFQLNFSENSKASAFEKLNLEYYKVLASLIGECYVQPAEEVLLIHNEIKKINSIICPERPAHRKKKRIGYACGSLLTDYAYLSTDWEISQFDGPTFAVEIKPKQGWIPPVERTYSLCTYCHNQYIKLQNGETSGISEYCPMDLFSGDQSRIKYAIKCLLKTPQNNLKIFKDGVLIYGENLDKDDQIMSTLFEISEEKSIDEFCDLITKALLKQLHTVNNSHKCTKPRYIADDIIRNSEFHSNVHNQHKICNLNRNELPPGCVLDRILTLQELDMWGSKTLCTRLMKDMLVRDDYTHVISVVNRKRNLNHSSYCAKCFFTEESIGSNEHNLDVNIQQYLMSAIGKDCSLMVTFRKLKNNEIKISEKYIIETKNGLYAFRIGVFDLYPKPFSSIYKHARKRDQFFEIYCKLK